MMLGIMTQNYQEELSKRANQQVTQELESLHKRVKELAIMVSCHHKWKQETKNGYSCIHCGRSETMDDYKFIIGI